MHPGETLAGHSMSRGPIEPTASGSDSLLAPQSGPRHSCRRPMKQGPSPRAEGTARYHADGVIVASPEEQRVLLCQIRSARNFAGFVPELVPQGPAVEPELVPQGSAAERAFAAGAPGPATP